MTRPRRRILQLLASGTAAVLLVSNPTAAFAAEPGGPAVPNPGSSGTPVPGPSYSPPPTPRAPERPATAAEVRGAAATDRLLAQAGGAAFYSSFEPGDPQPTWTNTAETDADGNKKSAGVTGSPPGGIPGNITDKVVEVTASGENTEGGRGQGEPRSTATSTPSGWSSRRPAGCSTSSPSRSRSCATR